MLVCGKTAIHGYFWPDASLPVNANKSGDLMTSLSTGASRKVPASLRLSAARPPAHGADLGRPGARWQAVRNPLGRALLWLLTAAVRPLVVWQSRLRDRAYLQQLPDYLLRDIGLDAEGAREEIRKPFWRP
jgi:uncharacterized protein YjiS (DUF1127 family)